MDDFNKRKLAYNDISNRLSFSLVEPGLFLNNTVYFISDNKELSYLQAWLNSTIINWYYKRISVQLGNNVARMFSIYMNELPIPYANAKDCQLITNYVDIINYSSRKGIDTTEHETEIDNLISEFYGLSKDEKIEIENHNKI